MACHYARCTGEDPDDLLQEAWVGLLEALPALDIRIGSPEQYLVQHARWRLLDAVKRARVRRCVSLDEALDGDNIAGLNTEHVAAEANVSEFLRELKSTQKAIVSCLLAGLTWREAGDVLGCTSANVAYHVRQIRQRYEEWSDDRLANFKEDSTEHVEAHI
jgi:RNA polymerase sigma-70 factor (ECF subfamily)